MIRLSDDPRLATMAADWLRKHRHGVDRLCTRSHPVDGILVRWSLLHIKRG